MLQIPLLGFSILTWVVVVLVYLWVGQPGFFGESLFVIMSDQADLKEADLIKEPIQKRGYVYQTSTEFTSASQTDFIEFLHQFRIEYKQY